MTAVGKAPVLACLGVFLWKLLQAQALVRYQLCSQEGPQGFLVLRVRNQDKIKSSLTCIKPFQSRGSVTNLTLVSLRVEASHALNSYDVPLIMCKALSHWKYYQITTEPKCTTTIPTAKGSILSLPP